MSQRGKASYAIDFGANLFENLMQIRLGVEWRQLSRCQRYGFASLASEATSRCATATIDATLDARDYAPAEIGRPLHGVIHRDEMAAHRPNETRWLLGLELSLLLLPVHDAGDGREVVDEGHG
jgi:hypothetical protein